RQIPPPKTWCFGGCWVGLVTVTPRLSVESGHRTGNLPLATIPNVLFWTQSLIVVIDIVLGTMAFGFLPTLV
ncbi:hypothetical protein, partial [Thiolapillus sp.]|uniref:hypothetical protein n=1 Tax=Thiolapillus sp. TaxID=2017437 RepID=UPI0025D9E6B8